jgi:hypothetical protein
MDLRTFFAAISASASTFALGATIRRAEAVAKLCRRHFTKESTDAVKAFLKGPARNVSVLQAVHSVSLFHKDRPHSLRFALVSYGLAYLFLSTVMVFSFGGLDQIIDSPNLTKQFLWDHAIYSPGILTCAYICGKILQYALKTAKPKGVRRCDRCQFLDCIIVFDCLPTLRIQNYDD